MIAFYLRARKLLHGDRGATAVEHGLIGAFIAVVVVASASALGDDLTGMLRGLTAEAPPRAG